MCEDCVFQNKCVAKNKLKPFIDNGKHIFEYIPNKIKELQAI